MRYHIKKKIFVSASVLLFLCLASLGAAGTEEMAFYFGVQVGTNHMGGKDFGGDTFVTNEVVWISAPKPEDSTGFGLVLGVQRPWISTELSYMYSSHNCSFFDPRETAVDYLDSSFRRHQFFLDVKLMKNIYRGSGVFGLIGFIFESMSVDNNFFLGESYLVPGTLYDLAYRYYLRGDASFSGFGLNLGAGVQVQIMRYMAISARMIYHPLWFGSAKGDYKDLWSGEQVKQKYEFDSLKGSGTGFIVSLLFTLPR